MQRVYLLVAGNSYETVFGDVANCETWNTLLSFRSSRSMGKHLQVLSQELISV